MFYIYYISIFIELYLLFDYIKFDVTAGRILSLRRSHNILDADAFHSEINLTF